MTARKRHADVAWTQLPLPALQHSSTWTPTNQQAQADAPATVSTAPTLDAAGRRRFERDQPLPAADELAAAAPRHDRGHVVAVAVTLTSAHADRWEITRRPLYGHAHAWRRTLAELATRGRTRAYNASNPRRCTWDSADGDAPP